MTIPVTDEMIERAARVLCHRRYGAIPWEQWGEGFHRKQRDDARAALEAALKE